MGYEDCVIDVGTDKKQFFMPAWPTLYPALHTGNTNFKMDTRPRDIIMKDNFEKDKHADTEPLT